MWRRKKGKCKEIERKKRGKKTKPRRKLDTKIQKEEKDNEKEVNCK